MLSVEAGTDGTVARAVRPSGDAQPTVSTDGPVGSPQYFSIEWNDHQVEPSESVSAVIAIISHNSGASPLQPARVTYLGEDRETLYSGDGASPVVVWVQPRAHEELLFGGLSLSSCRVFFFFLSCLLFLTSLGLTCRFSFFLLCVFDSSFFPFVFLFP